MAESANYSALSTKCICERLVAVFVFLTVALSSTNYILKCRERSSAFLKWDIKAEASAATRHEQLQLKGENFFIPPHQCHLSTQTQPLDQLAIAVHILSCQVCQMAAALTDQFQQAPSRAFVVFVCLQVFGQGIYARGQER